MHKKPETQQDFAQKPAAATENEPTDAEAGQTDGSSPAAQPWAGLRVAVIDDAMRAPQLALLSENDAGAVERLFAENKEVRTELAANGCDIEASVDEKLSFLASSELVLYTTALVGEASADALRMIEEHRTFNRLIASLEKEVVEVLACDPNKDIPDLTAYNLVLLDYYLEGPSKGGELAVTVAAAIRGQNGRHDEQQIVLMSSLESVRDLRGDFRSKTDITGSAFAFVGKSDLNEPWKVKAHLGMLERARPYAPAFIQYRSQLNQALAAATTGLLELVDDLDIGDYAFLQSRALMKDGHPLGDYVFWLLSSQLMALAFEQDEMRERQRALDTLEFVGQTFAATEPSTVVANLLHSALVSRNVGPLGPHPRAPANSKYAAFPLVQLGDVFLNSDRTKAVVVMSADCDLAFSPLEDREPESETPVMLVPGTPIRLKDVSDDDDAKTDGLLHREEVYRIVWKFAKYRSVELGKLETWLKEEGYDVSNRDRLRPLFALKLQQEFGAHLLRVGPPIIPPMTTSAKGRIFVCVPPEREDVGQFDVTELMLTRFKGTTWLRVTPKIAGALKTATEDLLARLAEKEAVTKDKAKVDLGKKISALEIQLSRDDFWIELLNGVELNPNGKVKSEGPLGFVLGSEWGDPSKPSVIVEILEGDGTAMNIGDGGKAAPPPEDRLEVDAVSAAG